MRSARTYTVVTNVDVAISSQGTNKPRNASVSLSVSVYFYTFPSGLSSGNWTAEGTERTAKRLRVTNVTGLLLASFFLDIQLTIIVLVISKKICLTLFRLGGGGLFEPPPRQNRDNSYTERAMTFKFSDFS